MSREDSLEEKAKALLRQKISGSIDRNPFRDPTLAQEINFLESQGYVAKTGQTSKSLGYRITDAGREFVNS